MRELGGESSDIVHLAVGVFLRQDCHLQGKSKTPTFFLEMSNHRAAQDAFFWSANVCPIRCEVV